MRRPTPNAPFNLGRESVLAARSQRSRLRRRARIPASAASLAPAKPSDFFGVDQDVRAFAQFISRYITKFGRWNSPKFLFGESYGTPRSAMLVELSAERQGIGINGVVLLSSVLDFCSTGMSTSRRRRSAAATGPSRSICRPKRRRRGIITRCPGRRRRSHALLPQVEAFAMGEYLNALAQGANAVARRRTTTSSRSCINTPDSRNTTFASRTCAFRTGASRPSSFAIAALCSDVTTRGTRRTISTASTIAPTSIRPTAAIDAAFVATGNYFMRTDPGLQHDARRTCRRSTSSAQWDWKHNGALPTNTAQDLAQRWCSTRTCASFRPTATSILRRRSSRRSTRSIT